MHDDTSSVDLQNLANQWPQLQLFEKGDKTRRQSLLQQVLFTTSAYLSSTLTSLAIGTTLQAEMIVKTIYRLALTKQAMLAGFYHAR